MARRPAALLVLAALPLAGCGGGGKRAAERPVDTALVQANDAGRQAIEFGRPKQAIDQYGDAYKLALRRDDAGAIGDSGYNLAVAQLASDDADASLRTIRQTRGALAARNAPGFAELDLVEAAVLHRLGRDAEAGALAARAQNSASPATVARASYVRGLAADARGDTAALAAALARINALPGSPAEWASDRDELAARLALRQGRARDAAAWAQRAAALDRDRLDYRAMAGALALAARALERGGQPHDAAELYLRAAESAAARGDRPSASRWLARATALGIAPRLRRDAERLLASLGH